MLLKEDFTNHPLTLAIVVAVCLTCAAGCLIFGIKSLVSLRKIRSTLEEIKAETRTGPSGPVELQQ
jgi:hypothetical protein